jgi:hypothetical protein
VTLTRDVRKVVVGTGALFVATGDTPLVDDDTPLFEGWEAPWVHPGFSEEGVNFSFERDLNFHRVEEQSAPVAVTVNESTLSFATALAETTLENYKLAAGGGKLTTTAPAAGQIGKDEYEFSDDLDVSAVGFEARNAFGFFRRIYVPRAVATGTVEVNNRRSESKKLFATNFQSISDMSQIRMIDKTKEALAA